MSDEKLGAGIKGTFDGAEPRDESEHFEVCPICGQAIDLRELEQVIYHGQPEHQPISRDA